MQKKWILGAVILLCLGIVPLSLTHAGGVNGPTQPQSLSSPDYTDQLIVKYRDSSLVQSGALIKNKNINAMISSRVNALSAVAGVELRHFRFMSGNGHVLKLPKRMTRAEVANIARKLKADPRVEYAEPDRRLFPMLIPNDPLYTNQWHYKTPGAPDNEPGGVNLPGAWDITTGSASVVAAVIDTGIRPDHADLVGRTVPGYNFISDAWMAGNGVGRSSDPSDLGDWIDADDCFPGSPAEPSSWHGTHVSGTIGAATNNSIGVAGINWTSKILPVRVLGKCGGFTSDIVDGMRWAVGLSVSGVPANANPAKVLNLSLGGFGACDTSSQSAIDDVMAAGATVVVAAGNSSTNVEDFTPANCNGVITVAAVSRAGGIAFYSNYGRMVEIAAPGGDQGQTSPHVITDGVLSTLNTGATTPVASPGGDTYVYYQGTSMATPHVTGIASLLLSVNPLLTPTQVLTLIQSTARTFPTGTGRDCTIFLCGSGIIDAAAAVALASTSADTSLAMAAPSPAPPFLVGNSFTQTITVTNHGPDTALVTTVTDTLSGTATIDSFSATPSQGSCSITSPITCILGTLGNGASATVTFVRTPATTGTISHTASVNSAMVDPDLSNNSATFSTTVVNPVPAISSLSPSSAVPGGAAFTLTVNGSNFASNSTVQWNGTPRSTAFVSFTQLTASILAGDIAAVGTASITVVNPIPGGGTSNTATFTISNPPPEGSGGGCFIATAAFGSPFERHVQILRDFRDSILLNSTAGKTFVNFYYKVSPPIAQTIAENEILRLMTRWALMPIVGIAYLTIHWGVAATLFLSMIMLLTFIVLARTIHKKLRII